MKCVMCDNEVVGKARTCSSACRKKASRLSKPLVLESSTKLGATKTNVLAPTEGTLPIAPGEVPPKYYAAILLPVDTSLPFTKQKAQALQLNNPVTRVAHSVAHRSFRGIDQWTIPGLCKSGLCLAPLCNKLVDSQS